MSAIKAIGLGTTDDRPQTLTEGDKYFSSFSAMVYDITRDIIYFSDVNR